jgi:hemolysin D
MIGKLSGRSPELNGWRADPAEFSPGLLRIQASPPHPLPRLVLGLALALFAAAFVWAACGRLDIIAVAQGKLVPQTYLKIVQPAEAGIVREILVAEGESVRAGQVLLRMDTTLAAADAEALRVEFQQKSLALRRIDAELSGQPFTPRPDDPPQLFREVEAQYLANRQALEAAIAEEQAAAERASQELAAAREIREKLEKVLPYYRERDEALAQLLSHGYVERFKADDQARERIEKEQDLKAQEFVIAREQANKTRSERRIVQLNSDYLKQLRAERAEVSERFEKLRQELAKQDHRQTLLELKAPQDGLVKDLATHTQGTVAQPGTILMTLVPAAESLRAEVWLSNDDTGFVRPGLPVKLKLAAFEFQKYGMLDGEVQYVAADATDRQDDTAEVPARTLPLAYRTLVSLWSQQLVADGVPYRLASGMQVTAEIKLGERTILEYLLSPVRRAFHEAARER